MVVFLTRTARQRGALALGAALLLFILGRGVAAADSDKKQTILKESSDESISRVFPEQNPDTSGWRSLAADTPYAESYYYGQTYYYGQSYYYGQAAYYGQSYYYGQAAYGLTFTKNASALSTFSVSGSVSKGSGSFVIDHPLDPENSLLYHSFVESPDVKNIYSGTVILNAFGEATITLPDYFMVLNTDFRYQLNPIRDAMPDLHVKSEIERGVFIIGGGAPGKRVSWQVTGIRQDPYIMANPIIVEVEKGSDTLIERGKLFFEGSAPRFISTRFFESLRNFFGR